MKVINFKKYSNRIKSIGGLETGEQIIDQEVDSDNNLIYIIRNGKNIRASFARDEKPLGDYLHSTQEKVITTSAIGTV